MSFRLRSAAGLLVVALASNWTATVAWAQNFPTRSLRYIVPFPPGGPADLIARVTAERMSVVLGQPVVIENRPGAAGTAGVAFVSRAEPDGYTIGIAASSTLSINHMLVEKPPYDPLADLTLITQLVAVTEVLTVNDQVPAKTLAELVALAKAQPRKLNYATPGVGTISHLVMELLKVNAGIDVAHVPYSGAAPAINDLLGGHVQMLFADVPVLIGNIQSGKLRALAVGGETRSPVLPDVPTARELGWHDVVADNWYGLVAPPRTPPAIAERLHGAVVEALRSNEAKSRIEGNGNRIVGNTPDEFSAYLKREISKWEKVIKAAGVKSK